MVAAGRIAASNAGMSSRPRPAFTLIEVVVGIVLLAMLLVGVVRAAATHRTTIARATARIEAAQAADGIAAQIETRTGRLPVGQSGVVPGRSWRWAVDLVGLREIEGIAVEVVRLRLADPAGTELLAIERVQPRPQGATP